jgi:microcompartment protein CcmL/EutN
LEATDAVLKQAEVKPLVVRPVSPGRFVALFSGEVEAVTSALDRGRTVGGDSVVDSLLLAAPHPGIAPALGCRIDPRDIEAVGVIETDSICSLLLAADGAAKCAEVRLIEIRLAMGLGGRAFAMLTGEVSHVESALERGTELARERGHFRACAVIPRPSPQTLAVLARPVPPFSDFVV